MHVRLERVASADIRPLTSDLLIARLAYGLLLEVISDGTDEIAFARFGGRLGLRVIRSGRIAQEDRLARGAVRAGRGIGWSDLSVRGNGVHRVGSVGLIV